MTSNDSCLHARSCTYFDVLHRLELDGDLVGEMGQRWLEHLDDCEDCRVRAQDERGLLEALAPGPQLSESRHEEILGAALARGADPIEVRNRDPRPRRPRRWRPAGNRRMAAFLTAACVVGVLLGSMMERQLRRQDETPAAVELEAMRQEVRETRQQLTLAQMRDPVASRRLSAVLDVQRDSPVDDTVLAAVISRLQYDPSVNVRLTAVTFLVGQLDRPGVVEQLIASVDRAPDPLLHLALIDRLAAVGTSGSDTVLRALRDSSRVDPEVREHAARQLSLAEPATPLSPSKRS